MVNLKNKLYTWEDIVLVMSPKWRKTELMKSVSANTGLSNRYSITIQPELINPKSQKQEDHSPSINSEVILIFDVRIPIKLWIELREQQVILDKQIDKQKRNEDKKNLVKEKKKRESKRTKLFLESIEDQLDGDIPSYKQHPAFKKLPKGRFMKPIDGNAARMYSNKQQ